LITLFSLSLSPFPLGVFAASHHSVKMHYYYIMGRYRDALRSGQIAAERITFIAQFKEEVGSFMLPSHCAFTSSLSL
jgi:hypothetical protein